MTETIHKAELILARLLLKKAIETRGENYVYKPQIGSKCTYLNYESAAVVEPNEAVFKNPNGAACLIGFMLVEAGVTFDQLQVCEGQSALLTAELVFSDHAILRALDYAQSIQDEGGTWGEAREAFETSIEESRAGLAGIL